MANSWRIDPNKITRYLLHSASTTGGATKATFFMAFGFTPANWQVLHDALIEHASTAYLDNIDSSSPYGPKEVYRCGIRSPDGRNPCICSVWQHRHGDWWFITAYPWP
ncbi:MAG TPA: hypothetical protein VF930_01760 [Stellaceae bacterium]